MVQLAGDASLADKAGAGVLAMCVVRVQNLDRDRALEADLVATKHLTHGAITERTLDAVFARDDIADLQGSQHTTFG